MNEPEDPKTLERQRVILEVLAGRMNVTEAALELGVSRKTYYEWQERALQAMRSALRDRPGGRPPYPVDTEKELLREQLETLQKERHVLEGRLRIQEVVRQTFEAMRREASPPKKKRVLRATDEHRGASAAGVEGALRGGLPGTAGAVLQPDAVEKPPPGW